MKIGWVSGWGVALEEIRPLAAAHAPEAEHVIYPPIQGAAEQVAHCDAVIGWSLGAHWILEAAARGVRFSSKVLLLAPFTSFCAEHGKAGRCSEMQVRYLRRWLETQPEAALADFRQRAGLPVATSSDLPYDFQDLVDGLERLSQPAGISLVSFARQGLMPGWEAYVGENDPLLNPEGVCQAIVGCQIISGAGHDLREFLSTP